MLQADAVANNEIRSACDGLGSLSFPLVRFPFKNEEGEPEETQERTAVPQPSWKAR